MFRRTVLSTFIFVFLFALPAYSTIFSTVRGIVHDPQHLPIAGAHVTIRAVNSEWLRDDTTGSDGAFEINAVPLGNYRITIEAQGFQSFEQQLTITSGTSPILHFPMEVAAISQTTQVTEQAQTVDTQSSEANTSIDRLEISRTPGGDQTNSLAMITDFVPGAYLVHDQLHIRGGHQVMWLVDGVPVPNSNIASNVGPQFDPKDADYIEVHRGALAADYGDRTYGVFNVVPRSGFERNREGELLLSYGNFNSTNNQLSFGDHTERFAYYFSVNGNRSDLGLETPSVEVLHDLVSGGGAFASLFFNATPQNQFRFVVSFRNDHYQIPNTLDQQVSGTRDLDLERDAFVNSSWVRTFGSGVLLTVSPYLHFNRVRYEGGPNDFPTIPQQENRATYFGMQSVLSLTVGKHNARVGVDGFIERQETFLGLTTFEPTPLTLQQQLTLHGNHEAVFLEDQYRVFSWLTLNGGLRMTRFSGALNETAADPRAGVALTVPHLGWILRGFYGRYYQPPPLSTVQGPVLELAASQGFGFLPLHGERDEQREFGLTIPVRGWAFDVSNFRTTAKNFFDHDVLGNSNIFFPLTLEHARIRGWESTIHSPKLLKRATFHLAFSHQFAEAKGGITGGLTDFQPPPEGGYYFLDHDQRNTLSTGFVTDLPRRSWLSLNVAYGSGFLNGDGPSHLSSHTTADLSLGKSIGENWSLSLFALNVTNHRYLLDNSNTFGGTHFADPREIGVEVKYRFQF